MKVDIVCFAGQSGLGHYAVSLARGLDREADVRLLTSHTMEPEVRRLYPKTILPFRRTRTLPLDIWRFVGAVLRRRPDVLLVQAFIKAPLIETIMVRLFRLSGIVCAATVHDVLPHDPKPWSRFVFARYYAAFDRLIAHSEAARSQLRAMGVGTPIAVVPHGVYDIFDTEDLSMASARERLGGLRQDDYVVLFFGHLETRKGLMAFVEAAERMAGEGPRFVIAGRSSLPASAAAAFEARCRAAGILLFERHIPFAEVQSFFAAADLVAMPYLEGTTSGILKLAIAFGRPVVATAIGDVPETVDDSMGVVIAPDNLPASLVDGIRQARSDAARLKRTALERRQAYGWTAIGKSYAAFLAEAVTRKTGRTVEARP